MKNLKAKQTFIKKTMYSTVDGVIYWNALTYNVYVYTVLLILKVNIEPLFFKTAWTLLDKLSCTFFK